MALLYLPKYGEFRWNVMIQKRDCSEIINFYRAFDKIVS